MKLKSFRVNNFELLCEEVWKGLWADNLRTRLKHKQDPFWCRTTYYLTASDMESAIRGRIEAEMRGDRKFNYEEWRHHSYARTRISIIGKTSGRRSGLKGAVRDWLLGRVDRGVLVAHNFDRGHISGMRFRPKGQPVGPQEKQTMERKARNHKRWEAGVKAPVHAIRGSRALLCSQPQKGHYYSRHRGRPSTDTNPANVTCRRCLKLLNEGWTEIAYGINRRDPHSKKKHIEHRNGRAIILGRDTDEGFTKRVIQFVQARHEGWALTGYCPRPVAHGPCELPREAAAAVIAAHKMGHVALDDPKWGVEGDELTDFLYDFRSESGIQVYREHGDEIKAGRWYAVLDV